ncbi:MAG: thioredoxin family protein [Mangrovibacterium sp.]
MIISNRFKQIIKSHRPVLVFFYAEWCQSCHQLWPVLKVIKNTFKENIRIIKVNVDDNPSIAFQLRVKNLPTLILFQAGDVKWMNEGVPDVSELTDTLKRYMTEKGKKNG